MSNTMKTTLIAANIVLFVALLYILPFETKVNQGLAILIFVAILWLSEAVHVTITAILIPILAASTGLMGVMILYESIHDNFVAKYKIKV